MAQQTFTMMGNNILQNFIHENKQDYDAPFAKLPLVRFAHELVPLLHEIEEKYGVPVVAMGDYNSHPCEPAYKTMCADFDCARLVAAERVNMEYKTSIRYACLPDPYGDGTGCVDHCFITRSRVLPDRYETVIDAEALIYTDHAPQRFTFRIR